MDERYRDYIKMVLTAFYYGDFNLYEAEDYSYFCGRSVSVRDVASEFRTNAEVLLGANQMVPVVPGFLDDSRLEVVYLYLLLCQYGFRKLDALTFLDDFLDSGSFVPNVIPARFQVLFGQEYSESTGDVKVLNKRERLYWRRHYGEQLGRLNGSLRERIDILCRPLMVYQTKELGKYGLLLQQSEYIKREMLTGLEFEGLLYTFGELDAKSYGCLLDACAFCGFSTRQLYDEYGTYEPLLVQRFLAEVAFIETNLPYYQVGASAEAMVLRAVDRLDVSYEEWVIGYLQGFEGTDVHGEHRDPLRVERALRHLAGHEGLTENLGYAERLTLKRLVRRVKTGRAKENLMREVERLGGFGSYGQGAEPDLPTFPDSDAPDFPGFIGF